MWYETKCSRGESVARVSERRWTDIDQVVDSDEDDIVISSRRKQYVVETPIPTPEPSECGEGEGEGEEVLGAPVKKRKRFLPWSKEGREKYPFVGEAEESDEECDVYPDDGWVHGQTCGLFAKRVIESLSGEETEDTEDDCRSFVVEDDRESVVEEVEKSNKELGRVALLEVQMALKERVRRLTRRLVSTGDQLGKVARELEEQVVAKEEEEEDSEEDAFEEVVDVVYGRTRREVAFETRYLFEGVE